MKKSLIVLLFGVYLLSGCAKPHHVSTSKSPVEGLFYTVETFNGSGPVDPDYTRVYAHLQRDGKSEKQLVLDGGYLDIAKITWNGSHDVTLCLNSGVTKSFRSEVTLGSGSGSETIRNHIDEHCGGGPSNAVTTTGWAGGPGLSLRRWLGGPYLRA